MTITIYTDGSTLDNNGSEEVVSPGGVGYVILYNGIEMRGSRGYFNTTNSRMEMLAIIMPLEELQTPTEVDVFTDSLFSIRSMTEWNEKWRKQGWRTSRGSPLKNLDLIFRLKALMEYHTVTYTWVKGHDGNYYNEVADRLALNAAKNPTDIDEGFLSRFR